MAEYKERYQGEAELEPTPCAGTESHVWYRVTQTLRTMVPDGTITDTEVVCERCGKVADVP